MNFKKLGVKVMKKIKTFLITVLGVIIVINIAPVSKSITGVNFNSNHFFTNLK